MENLQPFKFLNPTVSLVGSTGSGKTHLLLNILKNVDTLFKPVPDNLVILYSQYQTLYEEFKTLNIKSISLIKGIEYDFDYLQNSVLVIDDQMTEIYKNPRALRKVLHGCNIISMYRFLL